MPVNRLMIVIMIRVMTNRKVFCTPDDRNRTSTARFITIYILDVFDQLPGQGKKKLLRCNKKIEH